MIICVWGHQRLAGGILWYVTASVLVFAPKTGDFGGNVRAACHVAKLWKFLTSVLGHKSSSELLREVELSRDFYLRHCFLSNFFFLLDDELHFFFLAWGIYPIRKTTNLPIPQIPELQIIYLSWKDRCPGKSPFGSDETKICRTQSTDCASLTKTVNERLGYSEK